MPIHFEQLWEKCEKLYEQDDSSVENILDELSMKINLYKLIGSKEGVPADELQKVKSRALGEILLTLTHLSWKENINVFEVLSIAQQYRSLENYNKIPDHLKLP